MLGLAALLVGRSAAAAPLQLGTEGDLFPDSVIEIIDPPPANAALDPDDPAIARLVGRAPPALEGIGGRHVFWARLTVSTDAAAPIRWVMVPDRGWKRVVLYEHGAEPLVTGSDIALGDRPIRQGLAALPLTIPPGATRTYLLRFDGDLSGWEPPGGFVTDIETEAQSVLRGQRGQLMLGLYAGLLLAVTFVNLLFGRILRDRVYTDYVLYAIPYAMIWLAHAWIGTELLWPGTPWIDLYLLFVVICAAIVLGNRFAVRFLDMRIQLPRFHLALFIINLAVGACAVLGVVGLWRPVPYLLGLAAVATCVVYLIAGAALTLRGNRHGRFFLAATGTLAVGTIVYTLREFSIIPDWPLTEASAQIGSAVEMLLLALALADRVRTAERERRAAEARLRMGLEREVASRTAELNLSNERLIEVNHRLETLSLTDPLTGVANRRRFEAALEEEWRRAMRDHTPLALMLVDVDLFKAFNDAHGHQAGDECLRRVAQVLSIGTRRAGDLLARYGGEEFVLIFPGMGEETAMGHADRMRRAVADIGLSHPRSPLAAHVTVSIGVAGIGPDNEVGDASTLVARADDALYRAKRAGRDQVVRATATLPPPSGLLDAPTADGNPREATGDVAEGSDPGTAAVPAPVPRAATRPGSEAGLLGDPDAPDDDDLLATDGARRSRRRAIGTQ
jgi:diguanylate cyclase